MSYDFDSLNFNFCIKNIQIDPWRLIDTCSCTQSPASLWHTCNFCKNKAFFLVHRGELRPVNLQNKRHVRWDIEQIPIFLTDHNKRMSQNIKIIAQSANFWKSRTRFCTFLIQKRCISLFFIWTQSYTKRIRNWEYQVVSLTNENTFW